MNEHSEIRDRSKSFHSSKNNKTSNDLLPFSLHVVNINYSRASNLIKRNHTRNTHPNLAACRDTKEKKIKANRFSICSNNIYNRRKERYDQSCFSDYRIKNGEEAPANFNLSFDGRSIEVELKEEKQVKKEIKEEIYKKNQNQEAKYYKTNESVQKPNTSDPKVNKNSKKDRKIYSQTQRRSYLPNIAINVKGKIEGTEGESDQNKLDGWAFHMYPYDMDKRLDIIEYTKTRGQSRNTTKSRQQKIHFNRKIKNSILAFE